MSESLYVPLGEMLAQSGLTRIELTNDIKAGRFPGEIVRRQPRVLRAHWDAYRRGEWRPAPTFLHPVRKLSAA